MLTSMKEHFEEAHSGIGWVITRLQVEAVIPIAVTVMVIHPIVTVKVSFPIIAVAIIVVTITAGHPIAVAVEAGLPIASLEELIQGSDMVLDSC